ncbi:MAG TPA: hypothetical protein VMW65_05930 [Chloroflexota bacterium]|nr:hypothetical protein [Chloroflexota bacterium]
MVRHAEHPLGLRVITTLVVLNGVMALLSGWELLSVSQIGLGAIVLLVGLALLHRAYAIWRFQRHAYRITQFLIGFQAILALASALSSTIVIEPAIGFVAAVGALLYLAQPRVRALFR